MPCRPHSFVQWNAERYACWSKWIVYCCYYFTSVGISPQRSCQVRDIYFIIMQQYISDNHLCRLTHCCQLYLNKWPHCFPPKLLHSLGKLGAPFNTRFLPPRWVHTPDGSVSFAGLIVMSSRQTDRPHYIDYNCGKLPHSSRPRSFRGRGRGRDNFFRARPEKSEDLSLTSLQTFHGLG